MHVDADVDVLRLREGLRDLVALSAMPAVWIGSEPPEVAAGLADALVGLMALDFAFVRLCDPGGAGAVEVTRGSAWTSFPEWLERRLAPRAPFPGKEVVPDIGDDSPRRRGLAVPVGVNGEGGLVAAASERSDFPTPIDQLLLSLAANHAAAAFQGARLIHERKRAEEALRKARDELEVKVAERTAELQVANDELDALRRVATLVAQGVEPVEIFSAVSEEVGRLFGSDLAAVVSRFEHDPPANVVVGLAKGTEGVTLGSRSQLDDAMASAQVYRTGRSARSDNVDGSAVRAPIGAHARRLGTVISTVSSPIVVEGRLWGAMSLAAKKRLPPHSEERLENFTELVATAIANAESREALGHLAEEQAAERRVATLVAQGGRPAEIFSAVCQELGRLFGTEATSIGRFDGDPPTLAVVALGKGMEGVRVGSRWELDDALASTRVFRTGRSARVETRDLASAAEPLAETLTRLGVVSTVATPIIVERRVWGSMTVSSTNEPLPADTERRLAKFAELAATAIANADSRSELAASRRRIVAASDEARRRIERDLHDGTQQRLVSLALALRAAEADAPAHLGDLRAGLSGIAAGLADAVADLREISRGIHPAILSEGGLGPALRTLARRSTIPVELDITTDARVPEAIEVAAYYVTSEALANAAKHAQASRIEISLCVRNRQLLLQVRDDGVGGVEPARGSGLVGLTDRVQALGGSIRVSSPPGQGTDIAVELPVELEAAGES